MGKCVGKQIKPCLAGIICDGEDPSIAQMEGINEGENVNLPYPSSLVQNEHVINPGEGLDSLMKGNFPQNPYSNLMKYPNTQGNKGYPGNFSTGEIQKMIQIHSKFSPMTSLPHTRPQSRPQSSRQSIHHHHPGNYYGYQQNYYPQNNPGNNEGFIQNQMKENVKDELKDLVNGKENQPQNQQNEPEQVEVDVNQNNEENEENDDE